MRTEIFNPGVLINRTISKIRGSRKRSGWRSMMLWLLLLIAALTGCTDGAINAYMDYEPNRAPQILELQSDFGGLPVPGDIMTINCRVYDPDGNPLTYTFTSGQGSFTDQRDTAGGSEITFVVGNISGGEEVNVSVTVTDSKKASVAASLNIGTSSLGPVITLVKPMNTTIGADGYSPVTFRSSMKGYYQVGLAGDGIPADEFNPAKPLFIVQKNSDTLFTICGSLYSDDKYMEGIPRVPNGTGNRVIIKVMDGMGQISVHEILFDVIGATPVVANPEIRITDLTENSMTLNWNPATDPDNPAGEPYKGIEYRVYMSAKDNISTLEDTDSHGRVVLDWAEDLNFFQVEGLTPSTAYYFNVVVRDGDGVKEIYDVVEGRTKESIAGLSMLRYDGNGATGGVVPDYARYFKEGESVTVSGNTGNFINPDYTFSGWNTAPDGSGTSFSEGDSLTIGSEDIVLYALWRRGFVTTWKTDNPGASGDNQITIPVYDGEIYDYTVEWGDGSRDTHLTGSASHTYDDIGIYTVTIIGTFPRIFFNNSGDREKILTIEQWGEIEWTSMARAFFG